MPNRIIKDSIHESETVNKMTDFQFRLWVNLITYVDDYGRGDARPLVIKGRCFPLSNRITAEEIAKGLNALAAAGCIQLYSVAGKDYLAFPSWDQHQSIRNKRSKFPAPTDAEQMNSIESNCNQENADAPVIRIQSESESEDDRDELLETDREQGVVSVVKAWNAIDGVAQVTKISKDSTRYKALHARIEEHGLEKVLQAIKNVSNSTFLLGQNDRGWMASFDWFVKKNNFLKVLEGQYADRRKPEQKRGLPINYTGDHSKPDALMLAAMRQLMEEESQYVGEWAPDV